MASVTEPPKTVEILRPAERLVDEQIRRTRRSLKIVDLAAGMLTLVIGVTLFLLTAAVLEHWVISGGWSTAARTVLFSLLLLGGAWYSWRIFWPLLRQPINAAYAAQTIEQSSPALKNSLLNFLLLRNRKRMISRQVFQAIELQAAQGLSKVSLDSVVDRSAILRLGCVLLAVVAICALYLLLSPKDLVASAGRVLMPWTQVAVPSRVQLHNLLPGDAQAARGDQLKVSAEVLGLSENEPVRLLYSTADRQIVEQEILMAASVGGVLFEAKLPGRLSESGGVQQDFSYWIEAGDARSARFHVSVFARPTLVVQSVRYDYPDYTGYPSREEAHTGDIRAVEGTVVTVTAISNQPIQSGHVDFEANGRHDLLMRVEDERQATVSFPLELREDRRTPRYQSYMLRYTTIEGRKNKLPPKYQIDVTPDYSPEIRLLAPEDEVVDVMLDEQVTIEVEARDPDFAVQSVAILGEVGGEQVLKEQLLSADHSGRFVGRMQLTPSKLELKVGDVLEYWGAAADNRRPKANLAFTSRRKIRVVGPGEPASAGKNEDEDASGDQGENEDQDASGNQGESEDQGESGGEGQQGQGQSGAGESGEGMSDEQDQPQGGEGQAGESNEDQEDSQSDSEGQGGGNSEDDQEENKDSQNEGGESSDNSSAGSDQEKVSPDGDDDGAAFDRMAEHFDEQEGEAASEGSEVNEQSDGEGEADSDQSNHGTDGEPASAGGSKEEEPGEEQAPEGKMSQEKDADDPGENPGEQEGAPEPQADMTPEGEQGEQGASGEQGEQEAPSEAKDQSESDTEGSDGGDRSGEGEKGSGQESEGAGTGGAGEHQAADEGGGEADQPGEGNMSGEPGGEKKAEGETGESSQDQPGNGSEQGGQSGEQPGGENQGENGESKQGAAGEDASSEGEPSPQQSASDQDSASASAQQSEGGGKNGESSPPPSGETEPGDEANLDYARKQTDLILDKLDDQLKKKETDEKLLEKLGWSKDELRRFVDRWKNLKEQAAGEAASAAGQQELDDALRSLGLGRNRRTGFRSQTAKDKLRELQDSYRVKTPLEYQERVRAYIKGTAAAEEE